MNATPHQYTSNNPPDLEALLKNNVMSKMSRSFRGALFTQDLSFVEMKKNWALFVIPVDRVIANSGDSVYLHSPEGPEIISARVLETDNFRGRLILGEFGFPERSWNSRRYERVQPHKHTRALLLCSNLSVTSSLESLSLNGVGLVAYRPFDEQLDEHMGDAVQVEFRLPITHGMFDLPGKLVHIHHLGTGFVNIRVQTEPNAAQANLLVTYIYNRKEEIERELHWAFRKTSGPSDRSDVEFL